MQREREQEQQDEQNVSMEENAGPLLISKLEVNRYRNRIIQYICLHFSLEKREFYILKMKFSWNDRTHWVKLQMVIEKYSTHTNMY